MDFETSPTLAEFIATQHYTDWYQTSIGMLGMHMHTFYAHTSRAAFLAAGCIWSIASGPVHFVHMFRYSIGPYMDPLIRPECRPMTQRTYIMA